MLVTRFRTRFLFCLLLLLAFCAGLPGVANAAGEDGAGTYRDAQDREVAGLHPLLQWRRVVDADKPLEGPVLYQLLFNASGTPGTVPAFDTNPRHLINSPISISGGTVSISGNVQVVGAGNKFIGDGSGLTNLPITGTNGGTVTSVTGSSGVIATPNPITNSGSLSLDTTFIRGLGDARYLQLTGGTLTGPEIINDSAAGGGLVVNMTSTNATGIGVTNLATGTVTQSNAIFGATDADNGVGVLGAARAVTPTSSSTGVVGRSKGGSGIGVFGIATDTTPVVVSGPNTTPNQGTIGVQGQSNSPNGVGVFALDLYQCLLNAAVPCDPSAAGAPAPNGVYAQVNHANGIAVFANAPQGCALPACDPTKTGSLGVLGKSSHPNGAGVYGIATDTSVTNTAGGVFAVGVVGQTRQPTGYALYANYIPATVGVGAAALINNRAGLTATPNPLTLCQGVPACTILELQANGTREFHFDGAGNAHAAGTFMGGGADFAESVAVRGERQLYEPGDVLAIDPSGTRRLTKAHVPYSTLVAGIVSTKPALMGSAHDPTTTESENQMKDEAPLAIVGIVPCKVSAENGAVRAGDLLVTSSTAGYAMKGTDRTRMLGAVVGKAMQSLPGGRGAIEVLVTLQ